MGGHGPESQPTAPLCPLLQPGAEPPFDRVVLELNRLEGMDTMKRGLASLIRPRFGKRNFSSFRMSNRVAAVPEPLHGGAAFANFIFDLAKQMKPEAAFGGQMIYLKLNSFFLV